jgi:hypothetical protein
MIALCFLQLVNWICAKRFSAPGNIKTIADAENQVVSNGYL